MLNRNMEQILRIVQLYMITSELDDSSLLY